MNQRRHDVRILALLLRVLAAALLSVVIRTEDDISRAEPIFVLVRLGEIAVTEEIAPEKLRLSGFVVDRKVHVDIRKGMQFDDCGENVVNSPRPRVSVERYVGSGLRDIDPLTDVIRVEEIARDVNPELTIRGDRLYHVGNESGMVGDFLIPPILRVHGSVDAHEICSVAIPTAFRGGSRASIDRREIERKAFRFGIAFRNVGEIGFRHAQVYHTKRR